MEFTSLFSGAILGAFITAIIAALISSYFNIKTKSKEYENSYAKMILEKRLFAYEQINLTINILKKSTLDSDGKAYHLIFSSKENFDNSYQMIFNIFSLEFCLSEKTKKSYKDIFDEIIRCSSLLENGENIDIIGKEEYQFISKLRDELENNVLVDLKDLYKIDKFFNQKKIETAFVERKLTDRPN